MHEGTFATWLRHWCCLGLFPGDASNCDNNHSLFSCAWFTQGYQCIGMLSVWKDASFPSSWKFGDHHKVRHWMTKTKEAYFFHLSTMLNKSTEYCFCLIFSSCSQARVLWFLLLLLGKIIHCCCDCYFLHLIQRANTKGLAYLLQVVIHHIVVFSNYVSYFLSCVTAIEFPTNSKRHLKLKYCYTATDIWYVSIKMSILQYACL